MSPETISGILNERARMLARRPAVTEESAAVIEVLEFGLAQENYAVETRYVREVQPLRSLTRVPCTPAFVMGIVNIRGRILPVLDLKKFFGLPEQGLTDLHRIILVSDGDIEFGLLADVSVGVRNVFLDKLRGLPTLSGIATEYVKGVSAERLIVLDLGRILADPRIIVHEEVDHRPRLETQRTAQ